MNRKLSDLVEDLLTRSLNAPQPVDARSIISYAILEALELSAQQAEDASLEFSEFEYSEVVGDSIASQIRVERELFLRTQLLITTAAA